MDRSHREKVGGLFFQFKRVGTANTCLVYHCHSSFTHSTCEEREIVKVKNITTLGDGKIDRYDKVMIRWQRFTKYFTACAHAVFNLQIEFVIKCNVIVIHLQLTSQGTYVPSDGIHTWQTGAYLQAILTWQVEHGRGRRRARTFTSPTGRCPTVFDYSHFVINPSGSINIYGNRGSKIYTSFLKRF